MPAGEGWHFDPFGGEVAEGRVYGRGTTDNKGAVCAVYMALKALKECGIEPAKNIRLILGLDEETGWRGMGKYLESCGAPSFGFSPDADFPAIHGEMGIL
ncbi:MAG: M20/M25/M40 family metallo-hydrolase, partial [Clostridiales Family XIII bacterium]|nr:M20/M25/M40 family metallo-hydrolase [Clostridiales Family XIII bacterium]